MLKVNRLREFCAEAQASIENINSAKVVVTKDEIAGFMKDHSQDDNHLLLGIVPEHDLIGREDAQNWQNDLGFYILNKTDYSEQGHDGYIDIFANAQEIVEQFVDLIMVNADDRQGFFCDLFGNRDKIIINVSPVKGLSSCNGYFIGLQFDSRF